MMNQSALINKALQAANTNDWKEMDNLFKQGLRIGNHEVQLAFANACSKGHVMVVKVLLSHGIYFDFSEIMDLCIKADTIDVAKALIECPNRLNSRDDLNRPTHSLDPVLVSACKHGSLNMVKLLIQSGANIEYECCTSLRIASNRMHLDITFFLLCKIGDTLMVAEGFREKYLKFNGFNLGRWLYLESVGFDLNNVNGLEVYTFKREKDKLVEQLSMLLARPLAMIVINYLSGYGE